MRQEEPRRTFTWNIHRRCNYRCPYCFSYNERGKEFDGSLYLPVEQWSKIWDTIYKKYGSILIDISGGEPFVYPSFIELVKELSLKHIIRITTNLSGDIKRFAQDIEPINVDLGVSFHPLFAKFETFLEKVLLLNKRGFSVWVLYVAYPPQMRQLEHYRRKFEEEGLRFIAQPFRGEYKGSRYPENYTEEEKNIIRPSLGGDAGEINLTGYLLWQKKTKGRLCRAGHIYAFISHYGHVRRCSECGDKAMGNLLDSSFELFSEPMPCEAEHCSCLANLRWLVES